MTPAELAGGPGFAGTAGLPGRIEESFRRRLELLPEPTRQLVLLAAADPAGNTGMRSCCGGRAPWPGSRRRRRGRRKTRAWCRWGRGCGSSTRWSVRRCSGRLQRRSGGPRTACWRRRPMRPPIRAGGPGTGRRPRRGPMTRWPRSWRPPPSARPAGTTWRWSWWRSPRPGRWASWAGPRPSGCGRRSSSSAPTAVTARRSCCGPRSSSTRWTGNWPGRLTSTRCGQPTCPTTGWGRGGGCGHCPYPSRRMPPSCCCTAMACSSPRGSPTGSTSWPRPSLRSCPRPSAETRTSGRSR